MSTGETVLKASARLWFFTAIAGQLLFAFTVAAFYGLTARRGDYWTWTRSMTHGWEAHDAAGNFAVVMHLVSAAIIILAGALQFVPQVRARFPRVHRWTGRAYMLTAVTLSTAGLYMLWIRGTPADLSQRLGLTLNAVLIWLCAVMALRLAVARDFRTHRRWALRLFLVVSGAWFFRAGVFLWLLIWRRPAGFDPNTSHGPFLTFLSFAEYLLPLAVLELYFFAQNGGGVGRRFAVAAVLLVVTLGMSAGALGATMTEWLPAIGTAFDSRKSIVPPLAATIESRGIDAALAQYRGLRRTAAAAYNFDESQLDALADDFVRLKRFDAAVRIFALNVEAYPRSSRAYRRLAEAYANGGDRPRAIANYRKALALNPDNAKAAGALRKLGVLGSEIK